MLLMNKHTGSATVTATTQSKYTKRTYEYVLQDINNTIHHNYYNLDSIQCIYLNTFNRSKKPRSDH